MVLFFYFFFTFCLLFCLHFLLSFFKNRTINKRTFLLWPTSQVDRSLSSFVKWEWYLLRYFSFELNALEKLWLNGLSNCIPKLMQFKPSTNHCLNSQQISRMVQSENSICCNTIVLHYQIVILLFCTTRSYWIHYWFFNKCPLSKINGLDIVSNQN